MGMFYQRYHPPVTNRRLFSPERTPSPEPPTLTNRQFFEFSETLLSGVAVSSTAVDHDPSVNFKKFLPRQHNILLDRMRDGRASSEPPSGSSTANRIRDLPPRSKPRSSSCLPSAEEVHVSGDSIQARPRNFERPSGQLSKPNSGGYSLKDSLDWDTKTYKSVQDGLRLLCIDIFDSRLPFKSQHATHRAAFVEKARHSFPLLARYKACWPAEDFAAIYLKNTSSEYRKSGKGKTDGV